MGEKSCKFKKSKDIGFCVRNRHLHMNRQHQVRYFIPSSSISVASGKVVGEIQSVCESEPFLKFEFVLYSNSIFRVYIDEILPIFIRYRLPESDFLNFKDQSPIAPVSIDNRFIYYEHSETKIKISFDPFEIEVFQANSKVLLINSENLMNFERFRDMTTELAHQPPMHVDATGLSLEGSLWEENFQGHTDLKAKGPSSIGMDFVFVNEKSVYGIPEHTDSLNLTDTDEGEPYRLFNLDVFAYEINEKSSIYGCVPWIFSKFCGVFWLNASDTWIDVATLGKNKRTHWYSETGVLEFLVVTGDSPRTLAEKFTLLTGPALFPPLFALGYHQCRWNYFASQEVTDISNLFDFYDIPLDVVWLDIEHTENRNYFSWDYHKFKDPIQLLDFLAMNGRKLVNIVDPHFRVSSELEINSKILENGYFVRDSEQKIYKDKCWPGESCWVDFLNPLARNFWSERYLCHNYKDSTENLWIWNDMNEPAVFDSPESTMPLSNLHFSLSEHREVHNLYGHYMHKSTYDGLLLRSCHKLRPFVLSRSFFSGSQKYGAVWTGDNLSKWDHLKVSVTMCLGIASAGISFCGADVGGFFGEPSPQLMCRWYQTALFLPFFRAHAHLNTRRREPWVFDLDSRQMIRKSIRTRYEILPYFYSLFYLYSKNGTPVIRSMFLQYPLDEELVEKSLQSQFFVGDSVLVTILEEIDQQFVSIFLPKGKWYDFYTLEFVENCGMVEYVVKSDCIPALIKGGSVIPTQIAAKSSFFMKESPYVLIIALSDSQTAAGVVFKDDGESFEYRLGKFLLGSIEMANGTIKYVVNEGFQYLSRVSAVKIAGLKEKVVQAQSLTQRKATNISVVYEGDVLLIPLQGIFLNFDWELQLFFEN